MSCWVVPQLAADLWSISVQQVLDQAQSGAVRSTELWGFTFVDIGGEAVGEAPAPRAMRPATYVTFVPQEAEGALEGDVAAPEGVDADCAAPQSDLSDWKRHRARAALQRVAPGMAR